MTRGSDQTTPRVVLIYGLLGLIPFLVSPLAAAMIPASSSAASLVLSLYGALILSFLGGARWGLANANPDPPTSTVSLAMLPTLAGLALLLLPPDRRGLQLTGLAAALALHWLWDATAQTLPAWYPRLRTILTAGAVAGLLAGAVLLT